MQAKQIYLIIIQVVGAYNHEAIGWRPWAKSSNTFSNYQTFLNSD